MLLGRQKGITNLQNPAILAPRARIFTIFLDLGASEISVIFGRRFSTLKIGQNGGKSRLRISFPSNFRAISEILTTLVTLGGGLAEGGACA